MTSAPRASGSWRPYQLYVLALLLAVSVLNYLDRTILTVLQEPMKLELKLTDWQLGILSGPAFTLFYSFAGVPIARLAERWHRPRLLALTLGFWSLMTALCGAAAGFVQLALFRMGVGAGEGGNIPISHALLAEYFKAQQRGLVMSIVSAAPSIGGILTPLIGAYIAHTHGWRVAFFVVGLPGILVALVVYFTLREPRLTIAQPVAAARPSFLSDSKWLFNNRAFLYLFLAAIFIGAGNGGIAAFNISFLVRTQEMTLTQAGAIFSATAVFGLIGSFFGGWLSDKVADERGRSYVLVPAFGALFAFVSYVLVYTQHVTRIVAVLMMSGAFFYNLKNGPMFAAVQNIVPPRMRSTGAAVFMIAATAIGGGLGPLLTGGLSDFFARNAFGEADGGFAVACPGGRSLAGATDAAATACSAASATGLRLSLALTACTFLFAFMLLVISSRSIRRSTPMREPATA
ncbi:MAG: hypothetical protein RL030_2363 [Pseudomonadota bacterium]